MQYPFIDFKKSNAPIGQALLEAAARVIQSGQYIGGQEIESLEMQLAQTVGSRFAVGTGNGLDALKLIFRGLIELGRLTPGDEVLVSANTFIASYLAITEVGLIPVPVDAEASTMNMDTALLESHVTPKTKAILTVHLYGSVCFDKILQEVAKNYNLIVIEDSAQAIGAQVRVDDKLYNAGAIGLAAAFSFYPTKNIGALGDAGAVTTSDEELAAIVRKLANYGVDEPYHYSTKGYNSRLDPIQAAFLGVKLKELEKETAHRRALAQIYDECIVNPNIIKPLVNRPDLNVWHQYSIRTNQREQFRKYLSTKGVGTNIVYPVAPHCQQCYNEYSFKPQPITEEICQTVVSLPISTATSEADAREIAAIINGFKE